MIVLDNEGLQCALCGLRYTSMGTAKIHVERIHLVPKRVQCQLCNKIFKHKMDFSNHVLRSHSIRGVKNVLAKYGSVITD